MANRSCNSLVLIAVVEADVLWSESVLDVLNVTGRSESLSQAVVKVLITQVATITGHLSSICQGIWVASARASQHHLPGHLSAICQGSCYG